MAHWNQALIHILGGEELPWERNIMGRNGGPGKEEGKILVLSKKKKEFSSQKP